MMSSYCQVKVGFGVSVLYACKLCRHFFEKLDDFLEHKKSTHTETFQNVKSIVFEERSNRLSGLNVNNSLRSTSSKATQTCLFPINSLSTDINSAFDVDPYEESKTEYFAIQESEDHEQLTFHINSVSEDAEGNILFLDVEEPSVPFSNTASPHIRLTPTPTSIYNSDDADANRKIHSPAPGPAPAPEPLLFPCPRPNCDRKFKYQCLVKNHLATHFTKAYSAERPFKCQQPKCDKAFRTKRSLWEHQVFHSSLKPFKCLHPNCTRAFKYRNNLKQHTVDIHSVIKERPWKCTVCDFETHRKSRLNNHMKVHSKRDLLLRTELPTVAATSPSQNQNELDMVEPAENSHDSSFFLSLVGQQNSDPEIMYSPQPPPPSSRMNGDHHDDGDRHRLYRCHLCNLSFANYQSLCHHLKTHSGRKPFSCPELDCETSFTLKGDLYKHLASSHPDSRPFTCSYPNCGKGFKYQSQVNDHFRFHSKERNFKCTRGNCPKAFKTSGDLRKHLNSKKHAPLPPLPRQQNGADNNFVSSLRSNSNSNSNSEETEASSRFPCLQLNCERTFTRKVDLQKHHLRFHSDSVFFDNCTSEITVTD